MVSKPKASLEEKKERGARGAGSIFWDTKKSCYRGYALVAGKRCYRYGATKTEVSRKLNEIETKYARTGSLPSTTKFGDFAKLWLENRKPPISPHKTWFSYEQMLRLHILPELGYLKVSEIRPAAIQGFLTRLQNKVSDRTKQVLAPRTVRYARAIVHVLLKDAWAAGLCGGNACDPVRGPKTQTEPKIVWTEEELERFLQTTRGTRLEALWSFLTVTGRRIHEALAVTWADINLETGRVAIDKQLYSEKGLRIVKLPKSRSGIRTLCLPPPTIELLKQLRADQDEDQTLVFSTVAGNRYLLYRNILRLLHRECERAKVRTIGFHNFRHLAATYLIALGMDPRSVAEFLGHADKSLVMRTYAHVMSGHAERAADLLTPFVTLSAKQVPDQDTPAAEMGPNKAKVTAGNHRHELLDLGGPAVVVGSDKVETTAKPKQSERSGKKIKRRRKLRAA